MSLATACAAPQPLPGCTVFFLSGAIWLFVSSTAAQAQNSSTATPTPAPTATVEKQNSAELASQDKPTTFKVNVKLVVVRAVVRDSAGHAVGNLHKEDFQVFDKGKLQTITQFEVEQPGALTAKARQTSEESSEKSSEKSSADNSNEALADDSASRTAGTPDIPERFVAYLFDDIHLEFGDLALVRQAAERHLLTLKSTDRAAIFTTSGQNNLDFTDDRAKMHEALNRLQPRPISSGFRHDCPDISYYQGDLILNKNDPQAKSVAIQETLVCESEADKRIPPEARITAVSASAISKGEHESHVSLDTLKNVVHAVSRMPGQRSVVLISPGFIAPQLEFQYHEIIDHAVRSQVMINTLDARGLYLVLPFGDVTQPLRRPPPPAKNLIELAAASAQANLLSTLADGTGGIFFHNSNDFDEGFRRAAQAPEYSYVLAFTPQNLKLDGSFHALRVTLKNSQKLTLQARRGYYAPRNFTDPNEQAKQEIVDAMYSQEEVHNLPVKLRTQFFKAGDDDAKLVVLAHVDVQRLRFKKTEGRNNNVLTCVSGLFNRNGNFIQGVEKTVTMRWKDETLEHKLGSGITLKTSFDVKPGSYLVRLVVRDAEGQLMSAENGSVEIR